MTQIQEIKGYLLFFVGQKSQQQQQLYRRLQGSNKKSREVLTIVSASVIALLMIVKINLIISNCAVGSFSPKPINLRRQVTSNIHRSFIINFFQSRKLKENSVLPVVDPILLSLRSLDLRFSSGVSPSDSNSTTLAYTVEAEDESKKWESMYYGVAT